MAVHTTRSVKGVGLRVPRPDGPEKVSGRTRYVADLNPRGLLHARLLRSPHAHARIARLDTSKALAHSSVVASASQEEQPRAPNVASQSRFTKGDVAAGFAEADLILEHTYRVPMVHQGYLEPHAVLAEWDAGGLLTIWSSTQGQFATRNEVAE